MGHSGDRCDLAAPGNSCVLMNHEPVRIAGWPGPHYHANPTAVYILRAQNGLIPLYVLYNTLINVYMNYRECISMIKINIIFIWSKDENIKSSSWKFNFILSWKSYFSRFDLLIEYIQRVKICKKLLQIQVLC